MARAASLFNQFLQQFPRAEFQWLINQNRAKSRAKGFASWSQFVSMLFCKVVARADSLREISNGLACCVGKLSHLGLKKAPPRSILSCANMNRPAEFFQDLFYCRLQDFRSRKMLGVRKPFRFRNKLTNFDSTTIALALSAFPWAKYRSKMGGIKLHVLMYNADTMSDFVHVTEARVNDCRVLSELKLKPGSIVVLDRGYNDFRQYGNWKNGGCVLRHPAEAEHTVPGD